MALIPQQRSASARLRGIVRSGGGTLNTTGLSIWREENAKGWKTDIKEVIDALEALEVPYTVAIAKRPVHRSATRTLRLGWQAQTPRRAGWQRQRPAGGVRRSGPPTPRPARRARHHPRRLGEHVRRQVRVAEGVMFTTDADPLPAPDILARVFLQSAHEEWTGVRMGPREFFATLQMWLATDMPGFGTLTGDADALGHAPMPGQRTPALWNGTSLAYLLLPRVSTDPDQWEYLARGHGPNARALVGTLVERVRRWDAELRGGPGPRLLASPDLPPRDEGIPTRHTRLVALWDQPLGTPRLDWEADPKT